MKQKHMSVLEAITAILGLIALALMIYCSAQAQNIVSYRLMQDFERYKQITVGLLMEEHVDCLLVKTIPTIEQTTFGFVERKGKDKRIKAWVNPDSKSERPVIWINSAIDWTEDEAIVAIVHESLHLTKNDNGWFICGQDRYKQILGPRFKPVCRPFGVEVYDSEGLTNEVALHLGKVTLVRKD